MARVFLINPPSPEPVRTPLLSFCHLASSLRAAGHEVALVDASAPFAPHTHQAIVDLAAAFAPDLVGLHLKTLHVQPAYALAAALVEDLPNRAPLVAGGPHATICPDETLRHGFRFAIRGEGEHALVDLADALDGRRSFSSVAGLSYADALGAHHLPARDFIADLDALASPTDALDLFHPAWYGATAALPPAGILSSRGCPAACTFCSNQVTGRRFRYRSPASVAAEITVLKTTFGIPAFSFFDDSFAVGRRRVAELCAALADIQPIHWTCTAHPAHLDYEVLAQMRAAGCAGVDIGLESADPSMLLRIGKGVTVARVLDVLRWCRDLGIHTVVNLMFGWPDESDAELDATIAFLERAAPIAGGFNARGVVVPYPGTEIYDEHHERFGFTQWWLREPPLDYPAFPTEWSEREVLRAYAADPAIARNFFHHPPHRLARIEAALHLKAELTLGTIARRNSMSAGVGVGVPAAGAR